MGRSSLRLRLAAGDDTEGFTRVGSRRRGCDAGVPLLQRAQRAAAAQELPERRLQQAVFGVPGVRQ